MKDIIRTTSPNNCWVHSYILSEYPELQLQIVNKWIGYRLNKSMKTRIYKNNATYDYSGIFLNP